MAEQTISPSLVAQRFHRSATQYNDVAWVQHAVIDELLNRLPLIKQTPVKILELGVGTGYSLAGLKQLYPMAEVIGLDISQGMLSTIECAQPLCADAQSIPLKSDSIDFVFSTSMLHWINDLAQVFTEVSRVLKSDGLFMFAMFGPDTLKELRHSWARVDQEPHVHYFFDMHDVGDALVRAGFDDPVLDVENYTLYYNAAVDLMRDLKVLGASNLHQQRRRGLTARQTLQKVVAEYDTFRDNQGLLPATYEAIFGQAFAKEHKQRVEGNEVRVALNGSLPMLF